MLEKINTSPPYALTSSTSLTNRFRLTTLGDLHARTSKISLGAQAAETTDPTPKRTGRFHPR